MNKGSALHQPQIIHRAFETAAKRHPVAGAWIDRIRINKITQVTRGGRQYVVKTRLPSSRPIMRVANVFFRLARNPVRVLSTLEEWQQWEVACFRMLNGERYSAFADGARAVFAEQMPGTSLARHLEAGTFVDEMLEAAGVELRRAHGFDCAELGGAWSHGDPNLGNFVYDPLENRARLVDFELIHHRSINADERHAEDLLVFVQDLAGCVTEPRWVPSALRFLEAYDRPRIIPHLAARLVVPLGVPWLWWKIRCNYLPASELRRRIDALREALPAATALEYYACMDIDRAPR